MKIVKFGTLEEFQKIINIPLAIIIASLIIILITTFMPDTNGLSALLGGYSGLFLGIFFVILINLLFTETRYFDMFPLAMILVIVVALIGLLSAYFDRISKGEVSEYYMTFSILSAIFLFTQVGIIFKSMYNKIIDKNTKMFSDTTFSLLGLFSVINFIILVTIGIILRFYSTQG